eukprot:COSAG05_NODE_1417_length_4940_cov_7.065895_4_plen_120_part_00
MGAERSRWTFLLSPLVVAAAVVATVVVVHQRRRRPRLPPTGQAGRSAGGKSKMLNRPPLDVDELCSEVDPATGMACIKKRQSQVIKGKRYYKRYCRSIIVGSKRKRCHDFRRKPDEPWP